MGIAVVLRGVCSRGILLVALRASGLESWAVERSLCELSGLVVQLELPVGRSVDDRAFLRLFFSSYCAVVTASSSLNTDPQVEQILG